VQAGFHVRIIDGIEENKLMYLAVSECIKNEKAFNKNEDTVILVVGGSTTEIMMMSGGKMAGVHSLRLGTVRIEHQIGGQIASYHDIRRYVEESINNTKESLETELNFSDVNQFIAVGQDMNLAALLVGHPISTFLWEIDIERFHEFRREVQDYSVDEMVGRFRISYSEAETLQVSLLIYQLFLNLTKATKIIVPETNIRHGIILNKNPAQNELLQDEYNMQILASAKNLLRKYHGDQNHAECVRMIAVKIFDCLKDEISLEEHAKMLLEIAALLHDIGVFIKFAHHNFHSAYIIQNSDIFGLTKREISIVAEISKYHRGSQMPQDEENFLMMPRSDRMLILKLTAILRIADAMDRGHIQTFNDISVKLQQNALLITTKNSKNPVLERIALQEKAGMFESVFGYNVILV